MKYESTGVKIRLPDRKKLNQKCLDAISGAGEPMTHSEIFDSYTGIGGLHGLDYVDFGNYHDFSEAKKEIEQGQFFTSDALCKWVIDCIRPNEGQKIADLTCGKGAFFNYLPNEEKIYGCEIEPDSYAIASHLYDKANLTLGDIRTYNPGLFFHLVIGNPPYNLNWIYQGRKMSSQTAYILKAAELLYPAGLLAVIVPETFFGDSTPKIDKKRIYQQFNHVVQVKLDPNAFSALGVRNFPTKLLILQRQAKALKDVPYDSRLVEETNSNIVYWRHVSPVVEAARELAPKIQLEINRKARAREEIKRKEELLLYQIKTHPRTFSRYSECKSLLHQYYTQKKPNMADNSGPVEVYRQYKEYALEKYGEELEKRKQEIEDAFEQRERSDEFDDYDHVNFTYSFNPSEDVFMAELMEASTLIIAMFEINTDDWRKASFSHFKSAVDSVYFWNDTIAVSKADEEREVTQDDGESTLHIHITYDIFDKGVEAFRSKFSLADDGDYLKSVEMAYNIKIFFGEVDDMPMGGVTGGGGSGTYPGGGTHNAIRQAMAALENQRDFFGGSVIMPLPSGTWSITSEFGPRNFAPDPIHTGLDFGAASGTPIYSVMDGIVLLRLTNARTFGHHIVVYHGGGITTMYAHMSSFGSYQVGDAVLRGDVIGYVGRTGLSRGDHLHFEYQISGSAHNPRQLLPL